MNLRQMEVFRAVIESGSVTGAARQLNISQPAVTGLLRHTEDNLRFHLFERIRGRLGTLDIVAIPALGVTPGHRLPAPLRTLPERDLKRG